MVLIGLNMVQITIIFQFLIDRYNGSPTNNAAINGISQAIYGKGLNATDSNKKPNEYAQMVSLFRKDVVRRVCYDLKLNGTSCNTSYLL